MMQSIDLDDNIRDYVLIPMVIMMFVIGITRSYLSELMGTSQMGMEATDNSAAKLKPIDIKASLQKQEETESQTSFVKLLEPIETEHKSGQALARSTRIRLNYKYLPEKGLKLRKSYYCKKDTGYFFNQVESNPFGSLMNPAMMSGMLKQTFSSNIYNIVLFVGMGYLFSGFILAKIPFQLSQRFRKMLQGDFKIPQLDVSYVSSMSWSILLIFGLSGLHLLLLDKNPMGEDMKMMANPMAAAGGSGGAPGQPKDFNKLFVSERENFDLIDYKFKLENIENYIIQSHKRNQLFK